MFRRFGKRRIFCISFQRTGTTSVGKLFSENGYRVADYYVAKRNSWTERWFEGDYESIFQSRDFRCSQVFEDDPWWCLDFYKVLFHRFPRSRFVLMTRNSDRWFDSMLSHSSGRTLGNSYIHCHLYRRETEVCNKQLGVVDKALELSELHREHYKEIYEIRNQEVLDFFGRNDPDRLVYAQLEDQDKWQKISSFFGIELEDGVGFHENKSRREK